MWRTNYHAHGAAGARVVGHGVARQQLAAVVARGVLEAVVVGDALLAGLRGPCSSVSPTRQAPRHLTLNVRLSLPGMPFLLGCAERAAAPTAERCFVRPGDQCLMPEP